MNDPSRAPIARRTPVPSQLTALRVRTFNFQLSTFNVERSTFRFYLGHCYECAHEYAKAKPKLLEALKLRPRHLEYRAHNALGVAHFALGGYAHAKAEFEKTLETADSAYLKDREIWKKLEISCQQLGLKDEAEHYASLAKAHEPVDSD